MKILLTGATGYVGKRLLPLLIENGHQVVCCVRDKKRFDAPASLLQHMEVIETDFLRRESLSEIPADIDAAFYLMHSMSNATDYETLEKVSATNFREALSKTNVEHVVYLSGIVNDDTLSKHLASRQAVEKELAKGRYHFTTLRAGIIIGSGSASFEIIRDLVEKLPVMVAPRWLNTRCQPIAIDDVVMFLTKSVMKRETYDQNFDIGGPDILTYREMLLGYARIRNLRRLIITVPVMTPRLSSYWLYFVTSTSYKLATALVSSMKVEVICNNSNLNDILGIAPVGYDDALQKIFLRSEGKHIISSWKDSMVSGRIDFNISDLIKVPEFGCFTDRRSIPVNDAKTTLEKIWRIGGSSGWLYANWLWRIRGFVDKLFGGVGLRRGRTNDDKLSAGDSVDFWKVLYANKTEGRLLLFAEMKLPGEAWLEFSLSEGILMQTATFRPKGLAGRLYWYGVYPLHAAIFNGMLRKLAA